MSFDLGRALEDLADAGASRRTADDDVLTSRVGLMASRIRRRRAARYTGTTVVAACAAGAFALGVAYLPGLLGDEPSGPAAPPSSSPDLVEPALPLPPLENDLLCGVQRSDLVPLVRRDIDRSGADATMGDARVVAVDEGAEPPEVEYAYEIPAGTAQVLLSWQTVVSQEGVVVAVETATDVAHSPTNGATSTNVTVPLASEPCGREGVVEPGLSQVQVVVTAQLVSSDGTISHERAVSEPVDLEIPAAAAQDPVATAFTCGAPGPESIHTLPDSGGLTLAADIPAAPWAPGAEIVGTIGASDGRTILANVSTGVSVALVGSDGLVAAFLLPEPQGVELLEAGEEPARVSAGTYLATCGEDGALVRAEEYLSIDGTYAAWPFVTAVPKEVVTAEGESITPSSEPVIVIGNPVDLAFSG